MSHGVKVKKYSFRIQVFKILQLAYRILQDLFQMILLLKLSTTVTLLEQNYHLKTQGIVTLGCAHSEAKDQEANTFVELLC